MSTPQIQLKPVLQVPLGQSRKRLSAGVACLPRPRLPAGGPAPTESRLLPPSPPSPLVAILCSTASAPPPRPFPPGLPCPPSPQLKTLPLPTSLKTPNCETAVLSSVTPRTAQLNLVPQF